MDDPEDKKPEGYDDIPKEIPDPEAKQPDDWDEEDVGEWEAPMISNPEYKGSWSPKRIKNPAYKGEWKPKQIANEKYDEKLVTFPELTNVGFELWTVNNGTIFDNIYVGDSIADAKAMADATWGKIKEDDEDDEDDEDEEDEEKKEL